MVVIDFNNNYNNLTYTKYGIKLFKLRNWFSLIISRLVPNIEFYNTYYTMLIATVVIGHCYEPPFIFIGTSVVFNLAVMYILFFNGYA